MSERSGGGNSKVSPFFDVTGFEEFLDEFNIQVKNRPKTSMSSPVEGRIHSFLEHNFLRLRNLCVQFRDKITNYELIEPGEKKNIEKSRQQVELHLQRQVDRFQAQDSKFLKKMDQIYQTKFS